MRGMRISGCDIELGRTIKRNFGLESDLLEGHNGVFQVRVNGKSIWDDQSKCTRMRGEGEILPQLRHHADPPSGEEIEEIEENRSLPSVSPKAMEKEEKTFSGLKREAEKGEDRCGSN